MKKDVNIKYLNLGHGVIIENDKIINTVQESNNDNDNLELDDAFAEMIEMGEK